MLTNSLFLDFLVENGLEVWKEESTRDIICIQFDYGVSSYEEELKAIKARSRKAVRDGILKGKALDDYLALQDRLKEQADANKDKIIKKTRQQLREEYYENGVDIEYRTYNRKGRIIKTETIHYKMLYRTPGKAKKGSCMFIRDSLYDKAREFLYMGIKLPEENAPIVEIGAYSSLITSTIVDRIVIDPDSILVIKDIDAFFDTNVISVELDDQKHCIAVPKSNYRVKNTLFDGQALIDDSIFPEWGEGYLLLRHHFCKMAAFRSNIQLFFQDYFGDKYDEAEVVDYWGNKIKAKNVKLITTENALKWLKFGVSYNYWADWVRKNGCTFGIVKTAHQSKLGDVQRMSYQMVNALDMDRMEEICQCTKDYVHELKKNDQAFLDYLKKNSNFSNDYDVLVALVDHNPDFVRCDYFRERKSDIIKKHVQFIKRGKLIQNGDNLVIVGSPYAMLLAAVGEDISKDISFEPETDCIQCYAERFEDGECLAEFRSPFNSRNNLGYLHNHYHWVFKKYFKFGKQIIAINMIGTDAQDRNNGSDQDSDCIYVTNQPEVVACAKDFYANYPTIVNNIPKEKNYYSSSLEDFARVDNNLAASQRAIGESSNLAQIALSYTYNFNDQFYYDAVCILSVLAQCAIDNAKRKSDIDITEEIEYIKQGMNINQYRYPIFWKLIHPEFKRDKINSDLKCPMNYLYNLKFNYYFPQEATIPIKDFFVYYKFDENKKRVSKNIERWIEKYALQILFSAEYDKEISTEDFLLLRNDFDTMIHDIRQLSISSNQKTLVSRLINRCFIITPGTQGKADQIQSKINNNRSLLLKVLYELNPKVFLQCFVKNSVPTGKN